MNKSKWKPTVIIQAYEDRQVAPQQGQRAFERKSASNREEIKENTLPVTNPPSPPVAAAPSPAVAPPPPPPMPCLEQLTKPKAPPVPQKSFPASGPPPCPTPDYDTLSLSSSTSNLTFSRQSSLSKGTQNGLDAASSPSNGTVSPSCVDMDSLDSYKLNNPATIKPKPPSTYFNKPKTNASASPTTSANSSQNSTLRKTRPISVTIGEYPTGMNKRQPVKFDFLNNLNNPEYDNVDYTQTQPLTSRLASELAQTLSRSNLKKRTESTENLLNDLPAIKQTVGTVTISVNDRTTNYLNNLHKPLSKSQSTDVSVSRNAENRNRVTIKISDDAKSDSPSSILKNGNGNNCSSQHKPLVHQKSITFGEITTVISDRPMHVT